MGWIINAVIFLVASYFLPGFHVTSFWAALIAAVVLSFVGFFVGPILLVLTLPATILTLGLFTFVIDAIVILMVGHLVKGFSVDGFLPAIGLAVVLAIVNSIID